MLDDEHGQPPVDGSLYQVILGFVSGDFATKHMPLANGASLASPYRASAGALSAFGPSAFGPSVAFGPAAFSFIQ